MEENINDPHENFLMTVRMAEGFENKPAHRSEMRGVALLEEMKELDEDDDLPSSVFKIVAQQKDRLLEDISARERVDLLYVKNIKADFKRMIEEVVENNLTKVTDIIDKYEKIYERYCQKLDEYECQVLNDLETKVLKDLKTKVYSEEQADDERSDSENEILLEGNVTSKVYTLRCTSVSSESSVSSDSDFDVEVLTKDVGQQTDVVDTADKGVQTDFIDDDDDDDEGTDYYDVEDKGVQANFDYYYYEVEDKGVQTDFIDDDNDEEVTDDVDITDKGFQTDFIDDDDDEDDEVNLNFHCVEADDGSTKNLQKEKINCIIIKATKGCGTDDYKSHNYYDVKVEIVEAVDLEEKELVAYISDTDQHSDTDVCKTEQHRKSNEGDEPKLEDELTSQGYDVKVGTEEAVDLEDKELVAYISDTDQHSDADVCKTEQHRKSNEGDEPKLKDELTSLGYDVKVGTEEAVDLEDKELVAYISDTDQHSDADVCKIEHHRKSNEGDEPKLEDELTSQGSECSSFEICSYSESDDCDSSISKEILTFETLSNREEHSTLENGTRQVENQPNFDNASKKPKQEGKEYEEEFLNDPGRLPSDASRNSDSDEEFLKDVVVLNESDLPPLEEDLPRDSVSPEERGAKADDASKGHGGEQKDSEPSGHKDSEPSSYFSSFCKTIGLS